MAVTWWMVAVLPCGGTMHEYVKLECFCPFYVHNVIVINAENLYTVYILGLYQVNRLYKLTFLSVW